MFKIVEDLLKKKHKLIFEHIQDYFQDKNHILCRGNSLI